MKLRRLPSDGFDELLSFEEYAKMLTGLRRYDNWTSELRTI
jgi:hypothetical protein